MFLFYFILNLHGMCLRDRILVIERHFAKPKVISPYVFNCYTFHVRLFFNVENIRPQMALGPVLLINTSLTAFLYNFCILTASLYSRKKEQQPGVGRRGGGWGG